MAAAVFLHNAIIATDPPSPPSAARRPSSSTHRHPPHDRQSSISSVTLHTSTSEHSHPTEPLIYPGSSESSVYLDLLARQPTHPSSSAPASGGLSLQADPVTPRQRRTLYERRVRRRLKRLRWALRTLCVLIGAWAIYNTVRYYVGAWLNRHRDRQVITLVLGSLTALCVACRVVLLLIYISAPYFHSPRSRHLIIQDFLHYCSSLCLLAPAVVNFILVFLWRNSSDPNNSLHGRCQWDIDVVWSGPGGQCDPSPVWGAWLAGSLARLVLTAAFLIAYHAVSYKYTVTRRPSRRRRGSSIFRHSATSFPSASNATTASSRTLHPHAMATVPDATLSGSSATDGDGSGSQPRISRDRSGSSSTSDGEPRTLRSSRSRIVAGELAPPGSGGVVRRSVSAQRLRSGSAAPSPRQEAGVHSISPSSSEDESAEELADRLGRPAPRVLSGYTSLPVQSPARDNSPSSSSWDPVPDSDLDSFAAHFRALVDQVSRETEEAADYDEPDSYAFPRGERDRDRDRDDHVVLGRTIHRMPTIESLGSHEVMSLASMNGTSGLSRPSTRSNTLSNGDAPYSRSASRANSLDAALSLSLSGGDGLAPVAGVGTERVGEMGELPTTPTSMSSLNASNFFGSRSTGGSYHTAASSQLESSEER